MIAGMNGIVDDDSMAPFGGHVKTLVMSFMLRFEAALCNIECLKQGNRAASLQKSAIVQPKSEPAPGLRGLSDFCRSPADDWLV